MTRIPAFRLSASFVVGACIAGLSGCAAPNSAATSVGSLQAPNAAVAQQRQNTVEPPSTVQTEPPMCKSSPDSFDPADKAQVTQLSRQPLSPAQQSARDAAVEEWWPKRDALIRDLVAQKPEVGSLCAVELAGSPMPPAASLSEAMQASDLAVWGTVEDVHIDEYLVLADIAPLAKVGNTDQVESIQIELTAGITLHGPPWELAVTPFPGAPVLAKGDSVVVLAKRSAEGWRATIGGEFLVVDGHIDASTRAFFAPHPFADEADGLTPESFLAIFR